MTKETARQKAKELVAKMTVEEKLSQLLYNAPAIERLGIEEYNWWNESSHGIHGAGTATVFPHAIAMASTFDPVLVGKVADAVSTEGRAKYNKHIKYGDHDIFKGITFWAPNINIFRDPRWGRGQETFGEDPFLTSMLAVSYINGIQATANSLKRLLAQSILPLIRVLKKTVTDLMPLLISTTFLKHISLHLKKPLKPVFRELWVHITA